MSPIHPTEKKFEEHIECHLKQSGYDSVDPALYDKELCLIPTKVLDFITSTQEKTYQKLTQQYGSETDSKLCKRITSEIDSRGVIEVLRKGIKDRGCYFKLAYFKPKSGLNEEHQELFEHNQFLLIRQLKYSKKNENSIDIGIFINGIPIMLLELKNALTGQDHIDGIKQWQYDRDPQEPLFRFKRNIVYLSVGTEKVSMSTRLIGAKTRFLPFNKGIDNPVNKNGYMTHYLWDEVLQKDSVLDLIENFVHIRSDIEKVYDTKKQRIVDKKSAVLIFPRFHQLNAIRKIERDVLEKGSGVNYLVQHATGSGKSLSIGWLSHRLSSLYQNRADTERLFTSIIVVTDRKILYKQIKNTILQLEQTKGVVNPVDATSQELKAYLESEQAIIITTIQKFPFISETISKMGDRRFGVIIDEVHSSQSGETARHLRKTLSESVLDTFEEGEGEGDLTQVDKMILDDIKAKGRQKHISYFGFSGTPKNKTLEVFGSKKEQGSMPEAFDLYSMKQSIAEGFTLDVLQNYTSYKRYFKLHKTIKDDKVLPENRVKSLLLRWVDLHPHAIKEKVKIILHHFINNTSHKIEGKSRAMLVTKSRLHCVKYKLEFDKQMQEMNLSYRPLVGFSGSVCDRDTQKEYTESSMNNIPESQTEESFKLPKFRILIVNNKFQTGFDEPMLHTMYVDKKFGGLQCVQTLSRLNRTMKGKTDTFVLDFVNDAKDVQEAFEPYYGRAILEEETDPNKIYQIEEEVKQFHLFDDKDIECYVKVFYKEGASLEKLQGILDATVKNWQDLQEDKKESFRGCIYSYIRLYSYLSQIITFKDIKLEKLFIFLRGLSKKLPRREKDKLSDLFSLVDLEYFKIERKHMAAIWLKDGDGVIASVGDKRGAGIEEEKADFLSHIIEELNHLFDGEFSGDDKVRFAKIRKQIFEDNNLRKVMAGDNSEANKRDKFNHTIESLLLGLVESNLDFYNKVSEARRNRFIKDRLYEDYAKSLESATVNNFL